MRPQAKPDGPLNYDPGSQDGSVFTLHDGPPYANGKLHMGHALNKLLKDMVLRDKRRTGQRAELRANWDCHGLPLEQRFAGKRHKFTSATAYLAVVEGEARKWAQVQSDEMLSMGVAFNEQESSLSCDRERQALVMREFHRMVTKGLVSRRSHPSSWSPMEGTVLAGAETEQVEHLVPTATVLFPLVHKLDARQAFLAVWTTTPWSLPGNVGVAYNPDLPYMLYDCNGQYVVAMDGSLEDAQLVRSVTAEEMTDLEVNHPLHDAGYPLVKTDRHLMPADFVTSDKGTGLVHVGPAHAMEDYHLWRRVMGNADFPDVVTDEGRYRADCPLFGNLAVVDGDQLGEANSAVLTALTDRGMLLKTEQATMTLDVSWRSKGLLVTRPTAQWFVDLADAKQRAVSVVESGAVQMVPESSRARFLAMLKNRPDWLVSRQREWGVPLGLYVDRQTGLPEADPALLAAVQNCVAQNGLAGWWDITPAEHFARAGRNDHDRFEKVTDVLDVWFDSACVQNYGQGPADLVVEGSDQHRGWYSSTLLKAMALEDPLPFKAVLTHGFVVDANRRKMSKSAGNGATPKEVMAKWNRDVLRLWVAHVDVTEDVPFSDAVLNEAAQTHRQMRNTMRYLTGVLRDWTDADSAAVPESTMDLLLLAELDELTAKCNQALKQYDMRRRMELVRDFLDRRLSGVHLDARKDRLYCDERTPEWHQTRATLMQAYRVLLDLLEPLCPDMVNEMTAACPVHETSSVSVDPEVLGQREPLEQLARRVSVLASEQGLKLKNCILETGSGEQALLDRFGVWNLARLLKVDKVTLRQVMHLESVSQEECPRCRLNQALKPAALCQRCDNHQG